MLKKPVLQHNQDDLFPPLTLVTWCCYNVWFQPSVILSSQTVLYSRIMVTQEKDRASDCRAVFVCLYLVVLCFLLKKNVFIRSRVQKWFRVSKEKKTTGNGNPENARNIQLVGQFCFPRCCLTCSFQFYHFLFQFS